MLKYEYMVVYHYQNGMGRIRITTDSKIDEYKDVEKLDQYLKDTKPGIQGLMVTDFKLLRTYKSWDEETE